MSADAASEQPEVRTAYNSALQLLTREVERVVGESHDPGVAVSITALIVGALTIARATDDPELRAGVLQSCQQRAQALLALEPEPDRLSFFWMPPAGEQRVTEHSVGSGLMQSRSA